MTAHQPHQVDALAVASAAIALAMLGVYLAVIDQQGGQPLLWVQAVLVAGAAAAGYASWMRAPHRRAFLIGAGVALCGLGVLAILSIGVLILAAGVLALVSALRPAVPTPTG